MTEDALYELNDLIGVWASQHAPDATDEQLNNAVHLAEIALRTEVTK